MEKAQKDERPPPSCSSIELSCEKPETKSWKRYLILFTVSWNALVITSTSTSLLAVRPEIAATLQTTDEILNITNAAVLVASAFASLIWIPISVIFNQRIGYNFAIVCLLLSSIGTAAAPNVATFTAMRILTGLTGAYFMVAGQAFIAEIFPPTVRGRAFSCVTVGAVSGTALGPLFAGVIVTFRSWPKTGDKVQVLERISDIVLTPVLVVRRFNPSHVFGVFRHRQVLLANLVCGFLGLTQYGLLTSVWHVVNPRFNFDTPLISGLFYLALAIRFVIGSIVGGWFSDRTVKHWIAKRNGERLPRDRLRSGLVCFLFLLPVSNISYGWSMQLKFGGLALAVALAFLVGTCLLAAWNSLSTYVGEVIPDQRSEVLCSKYIVQYSFSAAATGAIVPLIDAIGMGWSFTILISILYKHFGGSTCIVCRKDRREATMRIRISD
ncbi:major facilitator superfamily domain-containing protein [Xylariaceae sp. FL0255]|nr:major facilitator superfamily domain-containing protein [Xylariaceae sp. FL0255]